MLYCAFLLRTAGRVSHPSTLPLARALRRGFIVTAANWPVVLVDFAIESLYKLALMVPILGGAFMVAAVMGADIRELVADGLRETAGLVLSALSIAPAALTAFVAAVGVVAFGGCLVMFFVKTGTLAVLVDAERHAHASWDRSTSYVSWRAARRFDAERVITRMRHFGPRGVRLATGLAAVYLVGAAIYVTTLGFGVAMPGAVWQTGWPLLVLAVTSATVVGVTLLHLVHDLLRIIVITDDCSVRAAIGRLRTFLINDARQVVGIFALTTAVLTVAGSLALLGAGLLTLIAWVPILGILAVPLQLAAWLIRGLVFQGLSLVAVASYQAQYRQSRGDDGPAELPAASNEASV